MDNLFFSRLLLSTFAVSIFIAVTLLFKRVFRKHISLKMQYNIWLLLPIMIIVPFIPNQLLNRVNNFILPHNFFSLNQKNMTNIRTLAHTTGNITGTNIYKDFTVSVYRVMPESLNSIFIDIWIIGGAFFTIVFILCYLRLKRIRESIKTIENHEITTIFENYRNNIEIRRKIIFGESTMVKTPISFGFLKPCIILPKRFFNKLSMKDINYIILHEIYHYKNRDFLINIFMRFFHILHWFNPIVWLAIKEMKKDQEIACDVSVLKMLDENRYFEYGSTLINVAENLGKTYPRTFEVTGIVGSKKHIRNRIKIISSYKKESNILKFKSIFIFIIISLIFFGQTPAILSLENSNTRYMFNEKRVEYEDLSSYFNYFEGSFVLYDLQAGQYCIYNREKSTLRVSPDSTYKIFSALFGLEVNIIKVEDTTKHWNGIIYPYKTWNKDQTLYSAMNNSVNWYFQELDKQIGLKVLNNYFNTIGYGNCNLSGGVSDYWMESSMLISPVEQVQLLKDFYTNSICFNDNNIETVKDIIKISQKDGAVLSGKTGTGIVNGKNINGWFIGYVENEENTMFFATNIRDENSANGKTAADITLHILSDKNIY